MSDATKDLSVSHSCYNTGGGLVHGMCAELIFTSILELNKKKKLLQRTFKYDV